MYKTLAEYKADVLRLRRARALHKRAEESLTRVIRQVDRGAMAMPESATLSRGHRVDLRLQLADGRAVHAEVFASRATVSRDVNALTNSPAEVRMAILLDDDVDKTLADAYLHELASRNLPGDFFPVIKLSRLLAESESEDLERELRTLLGIGGHETGATIPLEALRAPATDWYVEKAPERAAMREFLQAFRSSAPLNLFVTGPRGIGKSSFLNALQRTLEGSGVRVIKRVVDTEAWQELLTELTEDTRALVHTLGLSPAELPAAGSPAERFSHVAVDAATRLGGGIVYIVDQLERLFERGLQEVTELEVERVWRSFSGLTASLRAACRVSWVVAAREQYYFMIFPRMGDLEEHHFSYLAIGPLRPAESANLIQRASSLTGFQMSKAAATLLADRCYHHAQNILLSFVHFFSERAVGKPADREEMETAQPWADVFEADLRRLASRTERLVLYAMAESLREITSFEDIRSRVATEVQVSDAELRATLRRLQDTLWLIRQPRHDIFEFFHASLADHIRDKHGLEFPVDWSGQRLVETALSVVMDDSSGIGTERLMAKALQANPANHSVYFRAAALLEKKGDTEDAIRVLVSLRAAAAKLRGEPEHTIFARFGWQVHAVDKLQARADAETQLKDADERAARELVRLAGAFDRDNERPWSRAVLLCEVARAINDALSSEAAALVGRAADVVDAWRKSCVEGEVPDEENVWYLSAVAQTLEVFGKEKAAVTAYHMAARGSGYSRWRRGDLMSAVRILLKRDNLAGALALLMQAVNGTRGQATKADYLSEAAVLAHAIHAEQGRKLYRQLELLARHLERTSRTEKARQKWATIAATATSRST